jgi:hypothetical protein
MAGFLSADALDIDDIGDMQNKIKEVECLEYRVKRGFALGAEAL